jgi:hypothetical protein
MRPRPVPTSNLSRIGNPRSVLWLYQPPDFDLKFVPIIFVRIPTVATPEHDYPQTVSHGTTQQNDVCTLARSARNDRPRGGVIRSATGHGSSGNRARGPELGSAILGPRNKYALVAGHNRKASHFPLGHCLFDSLLARGNKIPPNVSGAVHSSTVKDDDVRFRYGPDRDAIARPENQQLLRAESIGREDDSPATM